MKKASLLLRSLNRLKIPGNGKSMMPVLWPNDSLYIKKIPFNRVRTDDIVLIQKNLRLISHRVIYRKNNYVITKGDNSLYSDGKAFPNHLVGVVYKIKRANKLIGHQTLYLLQSTHYFKEIVRLINALVKDRISYVILKGLPLHLYYKKAQPKRIYADCDVLIAKKDRNCALTVFSKLNYKVRSDTGHKIEFILNKKGSFPVIFDLHFEASFLMTQIADLDLLYPKKLMGELTSDFLQNRRAVAIRGEKFYLLSPSNQIIYLALHFFHHNFRGIFRLSFLDSIISQSRLKMADWQLIKEKIEKYKLHNFAYPVFFFLKKYYKTSFPKSFVSPKLYNFKNLNIFDDETRLQAGATRFKNIFYLSPISILLKIWVFLDPRIAYLTLSVLLKKFKRLFFSL